MALPLPKVVADVGPGGGLVTAMGGMNALSNAMLDTQINKVKAQYAPLTTQAEAASKLAYANLMGPQFLAKLMGNPDVVANSPQLQDPATIAKLYQSGMGGGTGNALMQLPGGKGQSSSSNSLSGWLADKIKGITGGGSASQQQQSSNPFAMNFSGPGVNPQLNQTMAGIANVESSGTQNPYSLIGKDTGRGDRALGKYQVMASNVPAWTKEAFGQAMTPEQFLNSPEAQEKLAGYMMNKHLNAGNSPQDVGSIWFTGKPLAQAGNVRDVNGTTPSQYVNKMNQGMNQFNQPQPTYAEKAAKYKSIMKEGEALGKERGKEISEIGKQQLSLSESGNVLDHLTGIIRDPVFVNMRKEIPFFQDKQLSILSKIGTPEQQKVIGDYISSLQAFKASTVNGFKGRTLEKEFGLADKIKFDENDTMGIIEGKLRSLKTLKEVAQAKNDYILNLMSGPSHMNLGQAVKEANRMVDYKAIEKDVDKALNPPTTVMYKKGQEYNIPNDKVEAAKKAGYSNGR